MSWVDAAEAIRCKMVSKQVQQRVCRLCYDITALKCVSEEYMHILL